MMLTLLRLRLATGAVGLLAANEDFGVCSERDRDKDRGRKIEN